jgi:signal transduction histidine kinase
MNGATDRPGGVRGILAGADRLEVWLHVVFVLLTVASAARYVEGHGLGDNAPWILSVGALLLAVYAAHPRPTRWAKSWWPPVWCLSLVALWFVLVVLAPSFAWCAVPLSFVALRVMPFLTACAVVAFMVLTVVVAWTSMQGDLDPTIVVGPICIAVLAVMAYRALEREAAVRQDLLDELQDAQGDLADAQHNAGALAERARLSREIHDSVAQGLSSINLLLQAAEQDWTSRPAVAREHVRQAALTSRDGLDEVRRVVRDLAPSELAVDTATALPDAVRRACERVARHSDVQGDFRVHGEPVPLPADVATALLRTVRGALANVVDHARASQVTVTLTYQVDSLSLDVRDDGCGFDPERVTTDPHRGRGLAGIRSRVDELGGLLVVESAPGEGTAIAVSVPLADADGRG